MANNPYYVQPAGGAGLGAGLTGLAQIATGFKDKKKQAQGREVIKNAYASGNPDMVFNAMTEYPELAKDFQNSLAFTNEMTRKNASETLTNVLSDPANAGLYLERRIDSINEAGGDASDTIDMFNRYQQDPSSVVEEAAMTLASVDPASYGAYRDTMGSPKKQTVNEKDFATYQRLLNENPEQAEMFARQIGLTGKDKTSPFMADFESWKAMEEGPEKNAFARARGFAPKDTAASVAKKAATQDQIATTIEGANTTTSLIDSFLGNTQYIDAVTGVRGKLPAFAGIGVDAELSFDQIKDSLTLDNLSKMSGVLTDKDIQVLSRSAAALDKGMSKSAMRKELQRIKAVLTKNASKNRKKLESQGYDFSGSSQPQAITPLSQMSDEDLDAQIRALEGQ